MTLVRHLRTLRADPLGSHSHPHHLPLGVLDSLVAPMRPNDGQLLRIGYESGPRYEPATWGEGTSGGGSVWEELDEERAGGVSRGGADETHLELC